MDAKHTPAPWGVMNDGPLGDGKPWTAHLEAAPGLTLVSPHNSEPICRVSGYCQPVEANARLIAESPVLLDIAERVWKHAKIDGTLPVLLLQDIEAAIARVKGA